MLTPLMRLFRLVPPFFFSSITVIRFLSFSTLPLRWKAHFRTFEQLLDERRVL